LPFFPFDPFFPFLPLDPFFPLDPFLPPFLPFPDFFPFDPFPDFFPLDPVFPEDFPEFDPFLDGLLFGGFIPKAFITRFAKSLFANILLTLSRAALPLAPAFLNPAVSDSILFSRATPFFLSFCSKAPTMELLTTGVQLDFPHVLFNNGFAPDFASGVGVVFFGAETPPVPVFFGAEGFGAVFEDPEGFGEGFGVGLADPVGFFGAEPEPAFGAGLEPEPDPFGAGGAGVSDLGPTR
jgi:hypothetical protein